MKRIITISLLMLITFGQLDASEPKRHEFSTAGFFKIENSGREVFNFNVGWRFYTGAVKGAEKPDFDDSKWEIVNTPHGLEYLPDEASGCVNYQGPAWYRKHFNVPENLKGKKIFLCFEAVMGKSKIWLNGKLLKEHFGGYLPIVLDVTDNIKFDQAENIIAVWADNSDDPDYPPGKPQSELDFTYFGGIYRDVWLYSTNQVHITNQIFSDKVAGGGIFVHYENLSEPQVDVIVSTEIFNETSQTKNVTVSSSVLDKDGKKVGSDDKSIALQANTSTTVTQTLNVEKPHLWHPDDPYLYSLISEIKSGNETIDGIRTRIGIRKIEFKGKEGFYLNNKPFGDKLMGANRHQDFGYIGNAMSNSLHWRDVKKLRNAGMRIIRSAHYPQDPAFMDACDELGMFIIVATPGWQFWGKNPAFEQRVYSDVRNMVRRDRNHPSVIMWEPILNETGYPEHFAQKVHEITHEEYPFPGCYTACDERAGGGQNFDIKYSFFGQDPNETYFIREWGDNVDDWSAHNSNVRGRRSWGEKVQIDEAIHHLSPSYKTILSYNGIYSSSPQLVGGTLWHSFDHNRGYHPDPFYGGLTDVFRQPKYDYYGFQSQRDPDLKVPQIENGPMIYIANELTGFSNGDKVLVFTNCDEVRLSALGGDPQIIKVKDMGANMPHPPLIFEDVYTWRDITAGGPNRDNSGRGLIAEGLINGEVVVTASKFPAKRETRLELEVDFDGASFVADGSDIVTVIAKLVDEKGNVKRLGEEQVVFEVSGEGKMIAENEPWANPRKIEWGTAPCLVQSTPKAGKITVRAHTLYEGINIALPASITFQSIKSPQPLLYSEIGSDYITQSSEKRVALPKEIESLKTQIRELEAELQEIKLKEVEKQQDRFDTRNH